MNADTATATTDLHGLNKSEAWPSIVCGLLFDVVDDECGYGEVLLAAG
jgi:hypothetical protein